MQNILAINRCGEFWRRLIDWYNDNARNFPWRETSNPYYILIAEFLLQQTHVRKVQDVYEKFTFMYPKLQDLAEANQWEVDKIIKPIGLVYRAERLRRCAQMICRDFNGVVPMNAEDLKKLPGVGSYICDAVLCYAYGINTVPIDTNVIRVFSRYFNLKSQRMRPRTDPVLASIIKEMFAEFQNTRIPNLAVLDFAAVVCDAKKPRCTQCPVYLGCSAVHN